MFSCLNHAEPASGCQSRPRWTPVEVGTGCSDGDEPADVLGKFEGEDPADQPAQVMPDDGDGFDVKRVEEILQFRADDAGPVVVAQHGLIRIAEAF